MSARLHLPNPIAADRERAVLRRTCSCGTTSNAGVQSCADCQRNKLKLQPKLIVGNALAAEEREADRVADAVMRDGGRGTDASVGAISSTVRRASANEPASSEPHAPPIVDRVLGRFGEALDSDARRFFESRFGRDFSNVRVHADAEAAASARAVDAHAYTVGNHLVFAASRYAPNTADGRRLLAHELTHVVQQGATLRRHSISPQVVGEAHRDDEDELPVRRLQRHVAIVGLDEAGPKADLSGEREGQMYKRLAECMAATPDPVLCDPPNPPGWASFTGTVPASSPFGAMTGYSIKGVDIPSQKCQESIIGRTTGPVKAFQGVFDPSRSWVKPKPRDAGDPTKNGSAAIVARCTSALAGAPAGSWYALQPVAGCAATPQPRGDRATTAAQCSTIVAKDFNDQALAESMRLLKHEQTHHALTCAMSKKGNDALAGKSFAQVDAVIHVKLREAQKQYDDQSGHGCDAAQQSTWESSIANGLPAITLF